ncbi:hypothetical protein BHM03_00022182 [Ensete ventricosum]|nr:hypothetical protein BHM03_00022182 [Ensete ventricosum]
MQINDRYEFPLQLDLDKDNGKYLSPEADRRVRNLYTLHSVKLLVLTTIGRHFILFARHKSYMVGQLREVSNKAHNAELKLFLEVELGLVIYISEDLHPVPPPQKTKEDILLFFKLYDPEKEGLR